MYCLGRIPQNTHRQVRRHLLRYWPVENLYVMITSDPGHILLLTDEGILLPLNGRG